MSFIKGQRVEMRVTVTGSPCRGTVVAKHTSLGVVGYDVCFDDDPTRLAMRLERELISLPPVHLRQHNVHQLPLAAHILGNLLPHTKGWTVTVLRAGVLLVCADADADELVKHYAQEATP